MDDQLDSGGDFTILIAPDELPVHGHGCLCSGQADEPGTLCHQEMAMEFSMLRYISQYARSVGDAPAFDSRA